MNKPPQISVIMPVHNAARFLEQSLVSLRSQSLENTEIILVDDGSTDSSPEILKRHAAQDQRIKVLTQANEYAGVARNKGLVFAASDYVAFWDADDLFQPDCLVRALTCAQAQAADLCVFEYKIYDQRRKRLSKRSWGIHTKQRGPFSLQTLRSHHFSFTNIAVWNKIYRRRFLLDHGIEFQPLRSFNDVYFSWLALAKARRICLCPGVGVHYRINGGGSISDHSFTVSDDHLRAFQDIEARLRQEPQWPLWRYDFKIAQAGQTQEFTKRLMRACRQAGFNDPFDCDAFADYCRDIRIHLQNSISDFTLPEISKMRKNLHARFFLE